VLQTNGKIVVAGLSDQASGRDSAVARLNSDGSLDDSFGIAGKRTIDFGFSEQSDDVALQSNGKIVLAGYFDHGDQSYDFSVIRLTGNGEVDSSFGEDGRVLIDFGSPGDFARAAAVQADGKIVVVGNAMWGGAFAVARLIGDPNAQSVTIDIQPDSLNLDSNGTLTVLVYGAANFNAAQINVNSVLFAGAHAWQSTLVDANHDGFLDLQLKFRRQDTILDQLYGDLLVDDHDADGVLDSTRQTAEIELTGELVDHALFSGSDSITLFLAGRSLRNLLGSLFG
jgi:uncharacterized delta-60 repeat protein